MGAGGAAGADIHTYPYVHMYIQSQSQVTDLLMAVYLLCSMYVCIVHTCWSLYRRFSVCIIRWWSCCIILCILNDNIGCVHVIEAYPNIYHTFL